MLIAARVDSGLIAPPRFCTNPSIRPAAIFSVASQSLPRWLSFFQIELGTEPLEGWLTGTAVV